MSHRDEIHSMVSRHLKQTAYPHLRSVQGESTAALEADIVRLAEDFTKRVLADLVRQFDKLSSDACGMKGEYAQGLQSAYNRCSEIVDGSLTSRW